MADTPWGERAYVADSGDDGSGQWGVTRIDAASLSLLAPVGQTDKLLQGIAARPGGEQVYVTGGECPSVSGLSGHCVDVIEMMP